VTRHKYNEKVLFCPHIIHPSIHPACMVCWWVLLVGTMWLVLLVLQPAMMFLWCQTYQPCWELLWLVLVPHRYYYPQWQNMIFNNKILSFNNYVLKDQFYLFIYLFIYVFFKLKLFRNWIWVQRDFSFSLSLSLSERRWTKTPLEFVTHQLLHVRLHLLGNLSCKR
jgi:hypothetical protein